MPLSTSYTAQTVIRGVGRPDDLAFDLQGHLLFSDEFSGTISRVNADGSVTVLLRDPAGHEGLPDGYGNLLLIDLEPSIHALIRPNPATGQRQVLASRSFIEPQGAIMDTQWNIFVSDDYTKIIIKYIPT